MSRSLKLLKGGHIGEHSRGHKREIGSLDHISIK